MFGWQDEVGLLILPTSGQEANSQTKALKLKLLLEIASINRGALSSSSSHDRVASILLDLEKQAVSDAPLKGEPAPVDGEWELIYSDVEPFRSSPFFWAFQNGLVQNQALAETIFRCRFQDSFSELLQWRRFICLVPLLL